MHTEALHDTTLLFSNSITAQIHIIGILKLNIHVAITTSGAVVGYNYIKWHTYRHVNIEENIIIIISIIIIKMCF